MRFLRDPLDCEKFGVTVLDADPGWTGKEHDRAEDGQKEVYVLLEGEATVTVDGEDVELEAGEALRIPADATREYAVGGGEKAAD